MATLFDMEPLGESGLKLNEAQRRAITHREGPLLVIAGAGTGKTRVITERIRHLLLLDESLSGENILGLTFTDKAAGEMKHRVVQATGERAKSITLSTFHSFCKDLLGEVDPNRILLDKIDHWILLRRNLPRLQLDKHRRLAEPGQFLSDFVDFFSRCQDELVSSGDYRQFAETLAAELEAERAALDEDTYNERAEQVALQREIARAYLASEALLKEKKKVSIGSLIPEAVALLRDDTHLRKKLQQRFRHILVDEFQDTNIAQLELLYLLSGEQRNVFVVGDDAQAIYRFRGASFGSFTLFLERFAAVTPGSDPTRFHISLTENYRSTPNILRVATHVIGMNPASKTLPKKLLEATRREGQRVRIAELVNPPDEARWVALELQRLHAAGRPWSDFAVLYRQHAHRDELVEELVRRRIPFVISKLSILDHPLVKDVLAYLRMIAKPFDDIACARVLAAPAWHLEARDLVRLAERAAKKRGTALYDVLQAPQTELPFDPPRSSLQELLQFLFEQRKALKRRTAAEFLSDLIEWLEIPQRAGAHDRKYVNQLSRFVKDWEPKSETRDLSEFLEYLDFFQQANGTVSLDDEAPRDAVRLMTVHVAKGLEFPHVFLLRVNPRAFPATERPRVFEFPERLMKEELPEGDFHIQEERRLFYVALTRAMDRLTVTTVTDKKGKISTFIEDMLMDPAIKRKDIIQIAPKLPEIVPAEDPQEPRGESTDSSLFPASARPPKIFSRIAQWAEVFHPPSPEPLRLSPSAVENYRKCPQRYLFGYLWSLKEGPKATLSFGSIMHGTVKRILGELRKGNMLPFEEAQRVFETEWRPVGFEDEYQEAEYKKDGLEQLRAFHATLIEAPPQIREQEKGFQLPLENNVIIAGRMDQVNSLGHNDVEIVDYKTGKPKKDADAQNDLQLSLYALAAKEIFEWNPVRLVFHYLQNNQIQVTTRDSKQLDEAQNVVQETAADIRAREFPAKPGFICRNCAYKPICPAHEESLSP
jgi:DNA helicase II / ATP-dependent DNA helicase PcrA